MQASDRAAPRGFIFAISAYMIWGLILPVFMKLLDQVPPVEIVAHRVLWAIPFAGAVLLYLGRFGGIGMVLRSPRTLLMAALTATLISINWGVYVYAITADQALAAALGYYINPLVNVLLGAIFLSERPSRLQGLAIALAGLAVLILTAKAGGLPWISLALALSFGTYGLLRKMLPVGPSEGFFLEVLILSVPAAIYVSWTLAAGASHFVSSGFEASMLVLAGPVTAIPLILFAAGAKLLHFSTIGILQYIVPTLLFLIAVFAFGEPFSGWQLFAFALIWSALILYTWSLFARRKPRRQTT